MSHLNRWSAVHGTYITKEFGLFGANSYVISLKYLYSSSNFNIKSTPVCIKILNIQCALYRLYCGAYCECNRASGIADRLLVTIAIAAIDIEHYTSTVQQGQRYDRLLVIVAIAATDFQNCTSTHLHNSLFLLYSYCEL